MFSLEVYGKEGKLHLNGLGGSYGLERLHFYKMLPEMGPPETLSWEFPMADDSWRYENNQFFESISSCKYSREALLDAIAVMNVIQTVYRDSAS